jgi:hypothetical protein
MFHGGYEWSIPKIVQNEPCLSCKKLNFKIEKKLGNFQNSNLKFFINYDMNNGNNGGGYGNNGGFNNGNNGGGMGFNNNK